MRGIIHRVSGRHGFRVSTRFGENSPAREISDLAGIEPVVSWSCSRQRVECTPSQGGSRRSRSRQTADMVA